MNEYKPNSHRSKTEQDKPSADKKRVEKVVTGPVKIRKRSEARKFADIFISEDPRNVRNNLYSDVLIPAVKKIVYDLITIGADMFIYGGTGRGNRTSNADRISYINYSSSGRGGNDRFANDNNARTRTGYNYDDIILGSRGEAEDVLDRMGELIETYGMVSVADLYDLVGKSCNYTDNKYGWTNIRNAEPIRVRDGYMLKLPRVGPLNQ